MSNYRIKIQYDGSRYRGGQRQQGEKNTIQGRIEQVEIVRKQKMEDGTDKYGATFIGMSDTDAIKIDLYQVFREA